MALEDRRGIQAYAPYAQEQDGVSERAVRIILERGRALGIDSGLPENMWGGIFPAAVYLVNLSSTRTVNAITPYEGFHKKKPDLSGLRAYGCRAFALHDTKQAKFAPRNWEGILVGYEAKRQW